MWKMPPQVLRVVHISQPGLRQAVGKRTKTPATLMHLPEGDELYEVVSHDENRSHARTCMLRSMPLTYC
jgi:hypothetical protein